MSDTFETLMTRSAGVQFLAERLDGRAWWTVSCPPETFPSMVDQLELLDEVLSTAEWPDAWCALVDIGTQQVLRTQNAAEIRAAAEDPIPTLMIVLLDKRLPVELVKRVLRNQEIDETGQGDIILLAPTPSAYAYHWPLLLVDAIGVNDPSAAASIRATGPAARS